MGWKLLFPPPWVPPWREGWVCSSPSVFGSLGSTGPWLPRGLGSAALGGEEGGEQLPDSVHILVLVLCSARALLLGSQARLSYLLQGLLKPMCLFIFFPFLQIPNILLTVVALCLLLLCLCFGCWRRRKDQSGIYLQFNWQVVVTKKS